MKTTDPPIIVTQVFQNNVKDVWYAITNVSIMRKWFFEHIENFEPKVGFKTAFTIHLKEQSFTQLWKITEVIPYQKITYNWRYKEFGGDSLVTFELTDNQSTTVLRLSTEILKDFPDNIPEFKWESGLKGWEYFIKESLKKYLEQN